MCACHLYMYEKCAGSCSVRVGCLYSDPLRHMPEESSSAPPRGHAGAERRVDAGAVRRRRQVPVRFSTVDDSAALNPCGSPRNCRAVSPSRRIPAVTPRGHRAARDSRDHFAAEAEWTEPRRLKETRVAGTCQPRPPCRGGRQSGEQSRGG